LRRADHTRQTAGEKTAASRSDGSHFLRSAADTDVPVQAAQFHFADEAIKRRVYVAAQIRRELTTECAVGRRRPTQILHSAETAKELRATGRRLGDQDEPVTRSIGYRLRLYLADIIQSRETLLPRRRSLSWQPRAVI